MSEVQQNISLQPYNTFGLDVKARYFASFSSVEELKQLLSSDIAQQNPLLILGGGSNVLLTKDFEGLVLLNQLKGIIIREDGETIEAAAGEVWHELVLFSIKHNLGGIENMSLIPGSVGAAPMQNIGAYGVEVKDVFVELEALHIPTLELKKFNREECNFGYRESVFKRALKGQFVITKVVLKLSANPELNTSYGAIEEELKKMGISDPTVRDVSNAVISIRQSKLPDPKEIGNSGSFFKNPVVSKEKFESLKIEFPNIANYPLSTGEVKLAAGWLIENAGWKGRTINNYGVHKNQALVLVNYGGAAGKDIYQLSEDILQSIRERFGVELEREVNII